MFERLDDALHERMLFSIEKTTHCPSAVFAGSFYDRRDQRIVVVEFEASEGCNEEKSCTEMSDTLKKILSDGSVLAMVLSKVGRQSNFGSAVRTSGELSSSRDRHLPLSLRELGLTKPLISQFLWT